MAQHPLLAVFKRRDRVLQVLGRVFVSTADAAVIQQAVEALLAVLPKSCRYDSIYRSLLPFLGQTPSAVVLRQLAMALAADIAGLKSGRTVWPISILPGPNTVVVQVIAAKRLRSSNDANALGFPIRYRLRILQGPGASSEIDVKLSSRFVQFLACRPNGLGFARPPKGDRLPNGRAYQHFETLVGMLIRLDLALEAGRPKIDNLRCTGSLREYNRSLIEMRWQTTFTCPFGFNHACHQCPKGQTSCVAATHPMDFQSRFCPSCRGIEEFDPYWEDKVCRKCSSKSKSRGTHGVEHVPRTPDSPGGNVPG